MPYDSGEGRRALIPAPVDPARRRLILRNLAITAATLSSLVLVFASQAPFYARPHWPRANALSGVDAVTLAHMGLAILALATGVAQLLLPKGTRLHRGIGWTWAAMMFSLAVLALFIPVRGPPYAAPYIFLAVAVVGVPAGLAAARLGRIELHRWIMTWVFASCLVAGLIFAFLPRRLVWTLFFA